MFEMLAGKTREPRPKRPRVRLVIALRVVVSRSRRSYVRVSNNRWGRRYCIGLSPLKAKAARFVGTCAGIGDTEEVL